VATLQRWFHGMAVGVANYENDPAKQAISDAANAEVDAAIIPIFERLERQAPPNAGWPPHRPLRRAILPVRDMIDLARLRPGPV
jgi:hypothetical protein